MKRFIEKLDLMDTEYASLMEKGIDPRQYIKLRDGVIFLATIHMIMVAMFAVVLVLFLNHKEYIPYIIAFGLGAGSIRIYCELMHFWASINNN